MTEEQREAAAEDAADLPESEKLLRKIILKRLNAAGLEDMEGRDTSALAMAFEILEAQEAKSAAADKPGDKPRFFTSPPRKNRGKGKGKGEGRPTDPRKLPGVPTENRFAPDSALGKYRKNAEIVRDRNGGWVA